MNAMKMTIAAALCAVLAGCSSTTIRWGGQTAVRDANGNVLVNKDTGAPFYEKEQNVYDSFRHWNDLTATDAQVETKADGSYTARVGKIESVVAATNLVTLVDTSFKGAGTLVGACISAYMTCQTGGASNAASASVASLATQLGTKLYEQFKEAGGDESKATVSTSDDGRVTVSDGKVSCTGDSCSRVK